MIPRAVLAAAWATEGVQRRDRAATAVAEGRATRAQAERDSALCALVGRAIDAGFPDLLADPRDDRTLFDAFAAADLVESIAARAPVGTAEERAHRLALLRIASALITAQCWARVGFAMRAHYPDQFPRFPDPEPVTATR